MEAFKIMPDIDNPQQLSTHTNKLITVTFNEHYYIQSVYKPKYEIRITQNVSYVQMAEDLSL